jgi:predicted NBD/HSP70 family sugar kinase
VVDPAKPSLDLLRGLTDEHIIRALMRHRRLTRAQLAEVTGVSKPTAAHGVQRLVQAGLVVDTGERTAGGRGRGRVGSYYALDGIAGAALVAVIAPEGIVAECVDVYGDTVTRAARPISRPARTDQAARALRAVVTAVSDAVAHPPRLAVVSTAGPTDRATGRFVNLPDSPFLLGDLDVVDIVAPVVAGPVVVDNDVNWAARAERDRRGDLTDFAYVYLGEGLGSAIVSDGQVTRGHSGIAGEIQHLLTAGRSGQAVRFVQVFDELGLRQPDSTAIDVGRLLETAADTTVLASLARAVSGVLAGIVALADPELIIIGGPWGSDPGILDAIASASSPYPRKVPIQAATVTVEPSLIGARGAAVDQLRSAVVAAGRAAT